MLWYVIHFPLNLIHFLWLIINHWLDLIWSSSHCQKKNNKMKMSNRNNQKIWFCLRNLLSCCLTAGISVICESSHEACCKFLVGMNGKYLRYQKCHPWLWSIKATRSIEAHNWDRFKRKTWWMHLNCILQYDVFFCLWKLLCCRKHLG